MTLKQLQKYLYKVYSKETCYPSCRDGWSINNPTLGHCAIVSLIVNDYFDGEIAKIYVDNDSHYFNLIDNQIIDLTSEQFEHEIDYTECKVIKRQDILTDDTRKRYNVLKNELEKQLTLQYERKD